MTAWRDRPLSQTWPVVLGVMAAFVGGVTVLVSACSAEAARSSTPPDPIVASPPEDWIRDDFQAFEVRVGERTITCVYGSTSYSGVLSCDWGAK